MLHREPGFPIVSEVVFEIVQDQRVQFLKTEIPEGVLSGIGEGIF